MRMTNSVAMRSTLRDLTASFERLQTDQSRLSTGKTFVRVSDNPNLAVDALTLRQQLRRSEQLDRSATDTSARLRTADTSMVSTLDVLARVKELTVQATNTGASTQAGREAIAAELGGLRDELISIANTQYLGRSLFNGTAAGTAYDPATGVYNGNATNVERPVAAGLTVTGNMTGEQIYGVQSDPAGDLFAVIDRLSTAVAAGDTTAIATEHGHLDVATKRVGNAAAEIGRRAAQLESIQQRTAVERSELAERISLVEDIDLAEAVIAMQASSNAYTATLQAAAKVLPPSLVDYLR